MGFWHGVYNAEQLLSGTGQYDPTNAARYSNAQTAIGAQGLAGQGAQNYGDAQGRLNSAAGYLQQSANGQNSLSGAQLQQGLQQNLAAQHAMAASASPQNQAMAARTAAIQGGNLGAGLAGQQATAGLQERLQAQQSLGQLLAQQQQNGVAAATGGYNAATNANNPSIQNPQKTTGEAVMGFDTGLMSALVKSDRRLKKNIADGSKDASKALSGLKSYSYDYKDGKYGKGKQLGIMAQDLEAAGLKHTIVETPTGKAVHGGKLAAALAAMMPGLDARLSKLEGNR